MWMWREVSNGQVRPNWTAILSISGSVAVSVALWVGLIRAIAALVN